MSELCEHFNEVEPVTARSRSCEECIALGAAWNELRVCLTCGHVGCCEDSQHMHALGHFQATGHPLIAPLERGETWCWCYDHRRYYSLAPELRPKRPSALPARFARWFKR